MVALFKFLMIVFFVAASSAHRERTFRHQLHALFNSLSAEEQSQFLTQVMPSKPMIAAPAPSVGELLDRPHRTPSLARRIALSIPSSASTSDPHPLASSSAPISPGSLQLQCDTMYQLYSTTKSCGWVNNFNYRMNATDCCSWYGATCDSSGWLTSLVLSRNNLCGVLGNDIQWQNFPHLLTLDLRRNLLSGSIPNNLNQLTSLQYLYISRNAWTGSLPDTLGQLPNLLRIYLNNNMLTGPIPASIANLSTLQQLDLHQNQLCGALPNLAGMSSLQMLFLYNNMLTSLPNVGWSSLNSLFYVDASFNNLQGCLPSNMALGPMLSTIDVSYNSLTCIDFQGFFDNPSSMITVLVLSHNKINGTISYIQIPQKLIYVDMSSNKFTGWALGSTAYTSQMIHLSLSNNSIETNLADVAAQTNFNYLASLDLSMNNFTGYLPAAFSQLTKLTAFNLTYSGMSRPIGASPAVDPLIYGSTKLYPFGSNYHCANVFLQLSPGFTPVPVQINNEYFHYNNCRCNEGFFGVPPSCVPCKANAVCPGEDQQQYMFAQNGYYALPDPAAPQMFVRCSETPSSHTVCNSTRVLSVPPTPDNYAAYSCAAGYTGRFCSACDHTTDPIYFKAGEVCAECFSPKIVYFLLACYVLSLVALMAYIYWQSTSTEGDLLGIIMFLIQTVGIVTKTGLDTPSPFQASSGGFSVANFRFIGLECAFPDLYDYFGQLLFTLLVPVFYLLSVFLVYYAGKPFKTDVKPWKKKNQKALLLLLKTAYLPSARAVFEALACVPDQLGHSFILRAQNVSCASVAYKSHVFPLALFFLIVFVFGYPLFLGFFFWKRRADIVGHRMLLQDDVLRFLIAPFRPTRFYWGIVILLRSLFLAIVVSSISFTNVWLPLSICIVLLSSFILHTLMKPYKVPLENWLEGASLSILILLFVLTLGLSSYSLTVMNQSGGSDPSKNLNNWAAYALLILCLMILITPGVQMLHKFTKYIKENDVVQIAANKLRKSLAAPGETLGDSLLTEDERKCDVGEFIGGEELVPQNRKSVELTQLSEIGVFSSVGGTSPLVMRSPSASGEDSQITSNKGLFWGLPQQNSS